MAVILYFLQQLCSNLSGSAAIHQEPHSQYLSKVVVRAAVSGNTWHYCKEDIYWHNQNILPQSNPHSRESCWGENKVLLHDLLPAWACTRWVAPLVPLCITAASPARSHKTQNCTKATALAQEEDCQPCTLDLALRILLPVEDHSSLLKYPSSARWKFFPSSEKFHITLCFVLVLVNTWAH